MKQEIFLGKGSHKCQLKGIDFLIRNGHVMTFCQVEGFLLLEESQRTQMKWDYLMERFKVYFQARPSQKEAFPAPSVRILALEPVTWDEALNVIK